ncbi:MAG: NUDIX hydrolase [Elusimicrobia bacterium]|nr:NUDIX hydrolase [Elusimicrobiota bacterium]
MTPTQVLHETSAGGIVLGSSGEILLIKVRNLKGERVWTFPKGHIEREETIREAASREVEEETGYRCQILKPLPTARYRFKRGTQLVQKQVKWFLMKPGFKVTRHDAAEVLETRWLSLAKAENLLRYPSDLKLIEEVRSFSNSKAGEHRR